MSLVQLKPKLSFNTFDRRVIQTNWRKINYSPMKKAGLLVRKIARGSIRRGTPGQKKAKRRPGTKTPKSWQSGKTPPMKMIFSAPLSAAQVDQVVGMVGFGASGEPVPGLHEHGGTAVRRVIVQGSRKRSKRTGKMKKGFNTKIVTKAVVYRPRPFMGPALMKSKERLPDLWRNSIR